MPFDQITRNRLNRFVGAARDLLGNEFTRQLQYEYGINPDSGEVVALDKLTALDDARLETARLLRATLDYYTAAAPQGGARGRKDLLDRIVREQAFTVLNRLCAIRMAEARGFLLESVGQGRKSRGFQPYAALAGSALGETAGAYRTYLFSLFDELALDLPALFDRSSPGGRLFPRPEALDELLGLINDPELVSLWGEDETIGWIYQYFNSQEERRQMRAESQAPRNSRELAVRNQFFTPRYVVEFLTDNTLGRTWYEMTGGATRLADSCRYLVRHLDQPIAARPLKDPRTILLLDPACGSMHFGLYAFDLYETIYAEAWELEERLGLSALLRPDGMAALHDTYPHHATFLADVPRLIIEHNIHGIDIDSRAVQIAGLSLWLRAHRSWQEQGIRQTDRPAIARSHVVCAQPMPGDSAQFEAFLKTLRDERLESLIRRVLVVRENQVVRATPSMANALCDLVRTVWEAMKLAGEAGGLLKIEEDLATAIEQARTEWEQRLPLFRIMTFGMLDEQPKVNYVRSMPNQLTDDFWSWAESLVVGALEQYALQADGDSTSHRMFASDAARGFAFIDLCRKNYDVVLMNPPFGDATERTKPYINTAFVDCTSDIFQAFVKRGLDLIVEGGIQGVISARTGFFLGNSADWRRNVIFAQKLLCFADLGLGVLDDALVEVAAYTSEKSTPIGNPVLTNRQLDNREKSERLLDAVTLTNAGLPHGFEVFDQALIDLIPDYTFAYWAPAAMLRRYAPANSFGTIVGRVKQGVATADDFRFVRLGWETSNRSIGPTLRWQRLSKGGEYSPVYDDIHLLLDWGNNGAQLKAFPKCFIRNEVNYFRPGTTYTARTASAFACKVLPQDCIFSHMAQTWFSVLPDQQLTSLGFLLSRVPQAFIELAVGGGDIATAGSAARRYTSAVVESVPAAVILDLDDDTCREHVTAMYHNRVRELVADETSCHFASFHANRNSASVRLLAINEFRERLSAAVDALQHSALLDQSVNDAFRLSQEEMDFVDDEIGIHPMSYNCIPDRSEVCRLFQLSEYEVMAEAVAKYGSKRRFTKKSYFVDRQLELVSHLLRSSPVAVAHCLEEAELSPGVVEFARSIISELIGFLNGRWDIRFVIGMRELPPLPSPFEALPIVPPGMLQSVTGLPATPSDIPAAYPLCITSHGITVDDPAHSEDLITHVRDILSFIWPGAHDKIEQEVCQALGVSSLAHYVNNPDHFFDDHLRRYSKSRRQAPIYWPLSVASGSYTLWLYYHRISDQTLYICIEDFVEPKRRQVTKDIADLRQQTTRSSKQERELERLVTLDRELRELSAELQRLALIWKPNLNDGVQITAAPLWKLFQHRSWQRTLRESWEGLEKGDYDWAHLAMSMWPARVVPKCVSDRSLAIAHNIEDLLWVEDGGRWRVLMVPDEEIAARQAYYTGVLTEKQRSAVLAALVDLAVGPARNMAADAVAQHLSEGDWDDTELALLFWPQRVGEKCLDDPVLAQQLRLNLPTRRTAAAVRRWITKLSAAGAPDLADLLMASLQSEQAFDNWLAELSVGRHDDAPIALPLWPVRVIDRSLSEPALAAIHDLRKYFWVQEADGVWRRRRLPRVQIEQEIAQRLNPGR